MDWLEVSSSWDLQRLPNFSWAASQAQFTKLKGRPEVSFHPGKSDGGVLANLIDTDNNIGTDVFNTSKYMSPVEMKK